MQSQQPRRFLLFEDARLACCGRPAWGGDCSNRADGGLLGGSPPELPTPRLACCELVDRIDWFCQGLCLAAIACCRGGLSKPMAEAPMAWRQLMDPLHRHLLGRCLS